MKNEAILEGSPRREAGDEDARQSIKSKRDPSRTTAGRNMDELEESPTQVNEDRSYDADGMAEGLYDSIPSSLSRSHVHDAGTEDRTLQPDDTGAVNFGNMSELPRPSSQVSEDGGFENTRGTWRVPEHTSQQFSSVYTPFKPRNVAFETPALPKNPFAAAKDTGVPLGGTQLFGQTQFSSAMKQISPGSSRPSPHILANLSPQVAETSPLKNRANVSSPTDIRTSSPSRLDDIPTTTLRRKSLIRIEEETPSASRSTGNDVVPESPTNKAPKSSGGRQPLTRYVPMKKSQEQRYHVEPVYQVVASDSESDSAVKSLERRKMAEKKRAQAVKEMESVSFAPVPRPNSRDRPVSKRRKTDDGFSTAVKSSAPMGSLPRPKSEEVDVFVADSQRRTSSRQLEVEIPTQQNDEAELQKDMGNIQPSAEVEEPNQEVTEERILATSPITGNAVRRQSEPEVLSLETSVSKVADSPNENGATSSLPPPRQTPLATYHTKSRPQRRKTIISSPATDSSTVQEPTKRLASSSRLKHPSSPLKPLETAGAMHTPSGGELHKIVTPSDSEPLPSLPALSAGQMMTRSKGKTRSPLTPLTYQHSEEYAASSSTAPLSPAPPSSADTTPQTRGSTRSARTDSVAETSPVAGASLQKRLSTAAPNLSSRSLRATRRTVRYDSESTDELHPSSSASVLERSVLNPKGGHRYIKQTMGTTQRGPRLFEGMAFALSFQDMKPQERTKLEAKIVQAGGLILLDGFEPLFEPSAIMETASSVFDDDEPLKLKRSSTGMGFTALVADWHSRKAKYMQALALGLPCIAHQWITACLENGSIVDWEYYLLCSGSSAVLGNALRSRSLPSYPATDATLADVVASRRKLLQGQRILAVVDSKKGRNTAKWPYIFLAQALGPSMSRVFTTKQATEALIRNAKSKTPFDWLYVDQGTGTLESVLTGVVDSQAKKRKRSSGAAGQTATSGYVRVLNDELLIQSLILGRIVQDGEMSF